MKCPKCKGDFAGILDMVEHVCRRAGASEARTLVTIAWQETFAASKISGVMTMSVGALTGLVLWLAKGDVSVARERLSVVMAFLEKIEKEEAPKKTKKKEMVQ